MRTSSPSSSRRRLLLLPPPASRLLLPTAAAIPTMGDVLEIDIGDIDFDLDSLLETFGDCDPGTAPLAPVDPWFPDGDIDAPPSEKTASSDGESPEKFGSPGSDASWATQLEKFLLDEDASDGSEGGVCDKVFTDDFFSDLFVEEPETVASPTEDAAAEVQDTEKRDASSVVDTENDGPVCKRRKRQMRNRDSAMKSRERKKTYIKDLETKSRYLEFECRRLHYAFQCCVAENFALRQCLQKEGALGALRAKQESAVLFMESLLLGSLFWLVSIVWLFLVPALPVQNLKDVSRAVKGIAREVVRTKRVANERLGSGLGLELVTIRRRCRGMRTKMKLFMFPLQQVSM